MFGVMKARQKMMQQKLTANITNPDNATASQNEEVDTQESEKDGSWKQLKNGVRHRWSSRTNAKHKLALWRMGTTRLVQDLFRTKNSEFLTYHVNAEASREEVCKTATVNDIPDYWTLVRACRNAVFKDSHKAGVMAHGVRAGCPTLVQKALVDCVADNTCGAVRVALQDLSASNASGTGARWEVKTCNMPRGLYIEFDEQHQKEPLTVYFERDWSQAQKNAEAFIKQQAKDMIMEQLEMERPQWLNYMHKRRKRTCTCDPHSQSCMADKDKNVVGGARFWCKVHQDDEEVCKHDQVEVHKAGNGQLWSEQLCTRQDASDMIAGAPTSRARCECAPSLGLRVMGTEKGRLNEHIKAYAESHGDKDKDALIGHSSCKNWYKDDKIPWCVVGFDSACADREEVIISDSTKAKVRVWKSHLPCQQDHFAHSTLSAMQLCGAFRLCWAIADWPRWLFVLPMMFMTYHFLLHRCADVPPSQGEGFKIEDEDDLRPSDWSSTDSGTTSESKSDDDAPRKKPEAKVEQDAPKEEKRKKKHSSGNWDVDSD
eukprot:gnl/MRDRNA2_/MRDRNA2_36541_c0_seq1.p1 gnl/MRDRNA2_/MRDRNA2_36541_c0~~gnl/MRDRNA2_/MRDRNA2_36541_c0_seq1.p1  ORF type:complete len:543 (-),score=92.91 gnl/MRDRNA2_/MRDRNA2_36541_c0_seq1:7-1635(-)